MDWSKCFLCQKDNGSAVRGSADGYKRMSKNLPELRKAGAAHELDFSAIDDDSGIENTLTTHTAVYHKSCYSKFNDTHLQKWQQKRLNETKSDTDPAPSRKRCSTEIGSAVCLFCQETDKENLCPSIGKWKMIKLT